MDGCTRTAGKEYDLDLVTTAPSVIYKVVMHDGTKLDISNPTNLPDPAEIDYMEEPIVNARKWHQLQAVGAIMELCQERRGTYKV